jgi:hypothetical protein
VKRLLPLLAFGVLGGISSSAADVPNAPGADEAPLMVTNGYGVSGLVLWLAADSGVTMDTSNNVISLADRTRNFILKAPSPDQEPTYVPNGLNGKPVLRFNGAQSLYSPDNFGTDLNRDMTFIIVAKSTSSSIQREEFPLYLGQNATQHANRAWAYYEGKDFFDGQFVGFFGEPAIANLFIVSAGSVNSTLTQATFYRNGTKTMVADLFAPEKNATFADLSEGVTMGAATDPACGWEGDIAEELVYDRQLTPGEIQTIWFNLSSKYGIPQTPPTPPAATKP